MYFLNMKNFLIFILFLTENEAIDENLFDDLWKNVNLSTSKDGENSKFMHKNVKKEEIDLDYESNLEENVNKIIIQSENCCFEQMSDIKPQILNEKMKKETLVDHEVEIDQQQINVPKSENFHMKFESSENSSADHWKREREREKGQKRKRKVTEENPKVKVIREFDKIRKEKSDILNANRNKKAKIEGEIAKSLEISRDKIYQWKKQFGLIKKFSRRQKVEKIEQFEKVKEEFSRKFHFKTNHKIDPKIAIKIGVAMTTIYEWKRKLGLNPTKKKFYSDAEKLAFVQKFEKMKKTNPTKSNKEIAKEFGIHKNSLRKWRKGFKI